LLFYLLFLHWKQDKIANPHQSRHTCNTIFIARTAQKSRSTVNETGTENLKIHKSPGTDKLPIFYQFWKILTHYQWTGTVAPINLSASIFSLYIHLKAYDSVWRVPYHNPSEVGVLKKLIRSIEMCLMEPTVKSARANIRLIYFQ
jgi:hypothetical protein